MLKRYIFILFSVMLISGVLFAGAESNPEVPLIFKFKGEFIDNSDSITFNYASVKLNGVEIAQTNDVNAFLKDGFFSDVVSDLSKTDKFIILEYKINMVDTSGGFAAAENLTYNFKIPNPYFTSLGQVSFNNIVDNSVVSSYIIDNTIATNRIAKATITNPKFQDNAINGNLNSIYADKIADNSITNAHIMNSVITPNKLNSVSGDLVGVVSINAANNLAIRNHNFGTSNIVAADGLGLTDSVLSVVDLGVMSKHIRLGNITTSKIANSAVTGNKIASGAITTDKIVDLAVSTNKVKNLSITSAKIKNYDIGLEKLNDEIIKSTFCIDKMNIGPVISNYLNSMVLNLNNSCVVDRENPEEITVTYDVSNIEGDSYAFRFSDNTDANLTSRWFCNKLGGYMSSNTVENTPSDVYNLEYGLTSGSYYFRTDNYNSQVVKTITCKFERLEN